MKCLLKGFVDSKMLGHKDVSITLKIYIKFIKQMGTIMGTVSVLNIQNTVFKGGLA